MAVLICHVWQANREKIPVKIPSLGVKLFLFTITVIFLGPLLRIIFLLGFVFCWRSKKPLLEVLYLNLKYFQSHRIVFEGEVSFPVQAVEDNRQHGELLEAGVDHRDVPHQGPPGAMVSAVLPLLGNVILFCSRLQNESYCDSLGNCLPSGVASVIPIINYVFYCLSIIFSILDTIQPETGLEKLGTKLTSPILSLCLILTLN